VTGLGEGRGERLGDLEPHRRSPTMLSEHGKKQAAGQSRQQSTARHSKAQQSTAMPVTTASPGPSYCMLRPRAPCSSTSDHGKRPKSRPQTANTRPHATSGQQNREPLTQHRHGRREAAGRLKPLAAAGRRSGANAVDRLIAYFYKFVSLQTQDMWQHLDLLTAASLIPACSSGASHHWPSRNSIGPGCCLAPFTMRPRAAPARSHL
jgi:hypothetical protein